jgi:hypothetical protein
VPVGPALDFTAAHGRASAAPPQPPAYLESREDNSPTGPMPILEERLR